MRAKPGVNTGDVESVAAVGEDSDLVALGELGQADGALSELPLDGGSRVEGELGEGAESLLLEALVRESWRGGGIGSGGCAAEPRAAGDKG